MSSSQDPANIYHGLPTSSDAFDASSLVPTSSEQNMEPMTSLQQVISVLFEIFTMIKWQGYKQFSKIKLQENIFAFFENAIIEQRIVILVF